MKINVLFPLDDLRIPTEYPHNLLESITEWEYPVLPKIGDVIASFDIIISTEVKTKLQSIKIEDFFNDNFLLALSASDIKNESVYTYYKIQTEIETVRVDQLEWIQDENDLPLPCIILGYC